MAATADGCAVCAEQDTTWQAYNTWGGVCLYGGFGSRWCEDGAPRSYVASYNRPMVTRDYRAINAPFGALAAPQEPALSAHKDTQDHCRMLDVRHSRTPLILALR